jgi:hypothetical protein
MVVPFRPFAALAFVATPALASVNTLPAVQLPTFNCNAAAAGGTINYSDGLAFTPELGFGGSINDPNINYLKMSCDAGGYKFSDSLDIARKGDKQMEYLKIKLDEVFVTSLKLDTEHPFDIKVGQDLKLFVDRETQHKVFSSFWDVTMLFFKYDDAGLKLDGEYKEFIGFEIDSALKFVDDASLKLDNGLIVFDPTNPNDGTVSIYATPHIPEPGSLVLLGTGLIGIGAEVRRRLGW